MELFAKLFDSLLVFVYHGFDRILIHGYLSGLSRPETFTRVPALAAPGTADHAGKREGFLILEVRFDSVEMLQNEGDRAVNKQVIPILGKDDSTARGLSYTPSAQDSRLPLLGGEVFPSDLYVPVPSCPGSFSSAAFSPCGRDKNQTTYCSPTAPFKLNTP